MRIKKWILSVLDPDGKLRTVKYSADKKNGFHASVVTDGHVVNHPQEPVQPHYLTHTPAAPQPPHHGGGSGGGGGGGGGSDSGGSDDGDEDGSSSSEGGGDDEYEAEG